MYDNEIFNVFKVGKKLSSEVYLDDPIGKDKDDNTVTLQEVLKMMKDPQMKKQI